MPHVRSMLWEMRSRGEVEVLQGGVVLEGRMGLEDVKGPIRARRVV